MTSRTRPASLRCEPARSIILKLGGIDPVAEECDVHRSRVWAWAQPRERHRAATGGNVPQRHHVRLLNMARRLNVPMTAEDFLPVHNNESLSVCVAAAPDAVATL
ncbi:hypothetical protein Mnod_2498 [Methylobacterium nodulans ORS 2060]|uniref:Uncharacterized protein n=1 Tax=Methylobacterium nodulans (strain LMG 21967 / CNCM I-2342 / ORS 2060) TaxID=460265 RepID=B8ICQ7_METNO|nr:hypothetical protein Mnod_2498 [Methylobacterium nodulans ORS 2060]